MVRFRHPSGTGFIEVCYCRPCLNCDYDHCLHRQDVDASLKEEQLEKETVLDSEGGNTAEANLH